MKTGEYVKIRVTKPVCQCKTVCGCSNFDWRKRFNNRIGKIVSIKGPLLAIRFDEKFTIPLAPNTQLSTIPWIPKTWAQQLTQKDAASLLVNLLS